MILNDLKRFGHEGLDQDVRQFREEIGAEETGQEWKNFEEELSQFYTDNDNDKAAFFKKINDKVPPNLQCPNGLFRWDTSGKNGAECGEDQIPVSAMYRKKLPFYLGYELRAFKVGWPRMVPEYERKHVDDMFILFLFGNDKKDVTLIQGAASIHKFNEGKLRLKKENVRAYLQFFCLATWAAEGPFLIHSCQGFRAKAKEEKAEYKEHEEVKETADFEHAFRKWEKHNFARSATKEKEPREVPEKDSDPEWEPKDDKRCRGAWKFSKVCLQYGRDAFIADFRVSKADGSVLMLDDWPLNCQAPFPPYRVIPLGKERPIQALALRRPRRHISRFKDLRSQVTEIDMYWKNHSVLCLRGLHVSDHVDLTRLVADLRKTAHPKETAPQAIHPEDSSGQHKTAQNLNSREEAKLKGVVIDECLFGGALLADDLQCAGGFEVSQTNIDGRMSCQWLHCERDLRLEQVSIRNCNNLHPAFDASLAQIDQDVEFKYVRVADHATFERAVVKGNFTVSAPSEGNIGQDEFWYGLLGKMDATYAKAAQWKLEAGRLGDLRFGSISLHSSITTGEFQVKKVEVTGSLDADYSKMANCTLSEMLLGNFSLRSATVSDEFRIAGNLFPDRADINGSLEAANSHLGTCSLVAIRIEGAVSFSRAEIKKDCTIDSVKIDGKEREDSMDLSLATIGGAIWVSHSVRRTEFAGGIQLSGITVSSDVDLSGIRAGGAFRFFTGTVNRLSMGQFVGIDQRTYAVVPTETGGVDMSGVTIKGNALFAGIRVIPPANDQTPAIRIIGCAFSGNLTFWSPDNWKWITTKKPVPANLKHESFQTFKTFLREVEPDADQGTVKGDIQIRSFSGTEIDFSNLKVEGTIEISDSHIQSNLKTGTFGQTACHSLMVRHMHCGGDGQFWGLQIYNPDSKEGKADDPPCSLSLRNSEFGGAVCLYQEEARKHSCLKTEIQYRVEISDCKAHRLEISGEDFREKWRTWVRSRLEKEKKEKNNPAPWVVLEGSKLDVLLIHRPVPVLVDFSGIEVGRWEVKATDQEEETTGEFLKLLKFSYPFNRNVYLAIEQFLRDEGRDDEASKITWAMRRRNPRHPPLMEALKEVEQDRNESGRSKNHPLRLVKAFFSPLLFFPIVYPWRSAAVVLAWLLFSWILIFSLPSNIVANDLHYKIDPDCAPQRLARLPCHPEHGHWAEPFAMAVRYHVPPADFVMQDDWDPSPDPPT